MHDQRLAQLQFALQVLCFMTHHTCTTRRGRHLLVLLAATQGCLQSCPAEWLMPTTGVHFLCESILLGNLLTCSRNRGHGTSVYASARFWQNITLICKAPVITQ